MCLLPKKTQTIFICFASHVSHVFHLPPPPPCFVPNTTDQGCPCFWLGVLVLCASYEFVKHANSASPSTTASSPQTSPGSGGPSNRQQQRRSLQSGQSVSAEPEPGQQGQQGRQREDGSGPNWFFVVVSWVIIAVFCWFMSTQINNSLVHALALQRDVVLTLGSDHLADSGGTFGFFLTALANTSSGFGGEF